MANKTKKDQRKISREKYEALARLASYPEAKVLWDMLTLRAEQDIDSIISYPETDPVKLAVEKAFLRGRIAAIKMIMKEVAGAAKQLEKFEKNG